MSTLRGLWLCAGALLCLAGFALEAAGHEAFSDRRVLAALLSGALLGPRMGASLCMAYLGAAISVDWLRDSQSLAPGAVGLPFAAYLAGWLPLRLQSERPAHWVLGCAAGASAYGALTWLWHGALASGAAFRPATQIPPIGMLAIQAVVAVALVHWLAEHVRARGRARHE